MQRSVSSTEVGRAYDHFERQRGRDTSYGFQLVPDGGGPITIETKIILPKWGVPAIFNGQTFRVVYLEDANRTLKNDAIDITILSGGNAVFHDSLDARPAGRWLAIPIGFALVIFGISGLRSMKRDANAAASDDDGAPSI